MKFIDLVGTYEMPQKVREHAEKVREEVRKEDAKEERKKAYEELQRRKQEKQVLKQPKVLWGYTGVLWDYSGDLRSGICLSHRCHLSLNCSPPLNISAELLQYVARYHSTCSKDLHSR
jgi:hypothetical protein